MLPLANDRDAAVDVQFMAVAMVSGLAIMGSANGDTATLKSAA